MEDEQSASQTAWRSAISGSSKLSISTSQRPRRRRKKKHLYPTGRKLLLQSIPIKLFLTRSTASPRWTESICAFFDTWTSPEALLIHYCPRYKARGRLAIAKHAEDSLSHREILDLEKAQATRPSTRASRAERLALLHNPLAPPPTWVTRCLSYTLQEADQSLRFQLGTLIPSHHRCLLPLCSIRSPPDTHLQSSLGCHAAYTYDVRGWVGPAYRRTAVRGYSEWRWACLWAEAGGAEYDACQEMARRIRWP